MSPPTPVTLAEAMAKAGDALKLKWRPDGKNPFVPRVPKEFVGWRQEQTAWAEGVALFDLSHHMLDLFIEGPDALKLLSNVSANNYEKFPVGQAKQLVCVTEEGKLIADAIMARLAENKFNLVGTGPALSWVQYHAKKGGYNVNIHFDDTSEFRKGDPVVFRLQVQGPKAAPLLKKLFGDQLEGIKFFHFKEVTLDGHKFNALRHGMAGQEGFEFFGPYNLEPAVKAKIIEAGKEFGLVQVGGMAYYTVGIDSGWLPTPIPAIYTSPALEDYRKSISLYTFEGMFPIKGSYYSPNIEDYYHSPYELGYGRSIAFNHDFIGRAALEKLKDTCKRSKVTLVWNRDDVKRVFGISPDYFVNWNKDRVEVGGKLIGMSQYAGYFAYAGTVHSLAILDNEYVTPGTEVTLLFGQHPGPDAKPGETGKFETIRCVVQPAPLTEHARNEYRKK